MLGQAQRAIDTCIGPNDARDGESHRLDSPYVVARKVHIEEHFWQIETAAARNSPLPNMHRLLILHKRQLWLHLHHRSFMPFRIVPNYALACFAPYIPWVTIKMGFPIHSVYI